MSGGLGVGHPAKGSLRGPRKAATAGRAYR
jgi:hypothetical protein